VQPVVDAGARILHVLPTDESRGAQVFARALCDRLQHRGDDHPIVTIFRGPSGSLDADVRLDVGTRWRPYSPRALARLRSYVATAQPDLVVAHGGEAMKYAALASRGRPIVYNKIGLSAGSLGRRGRRRAYRWVVTKAEAVVAVSDEVADELSWLFRVPRERVWVIPNGRDPAIYHPGPTHEREATSVMWVGALEHGKRPDWFVEAVRRLQRMHPSLRAVVVGDGPLRSELAAAAPPGTTFLGRRQDVPALLREADLLILTSAGEGFPGILIEAGMSGVPVVTTAVAGAGAVVEDGVTGRIVDVDDLDGIVAAAAALLADPVGRRRMGAAAAARCRTTLTIDASAEGWQAMFDHVLGRRSRLELS
jgi:glycosyltransferase involved in cell wall biosynthesis